METRYSVTTAMSRTTESQERLVLQQVVSSRRATRLFKTKKAKEQEVVSLQKRLLSYLLQIPICQYVSLLFSIRLSTLF